MSPSHPGPAVFPLGIAAALFFIFASLLPAPASAQNAEEAARLNDEGFELFESGEFAAAARKFRSAHEELNRPEFRKNEAVAWFKADRCEQAVGAAQAYLSAEGQPVDHQAQARSIVANCKVKLAREALDAGSVKVAVTLLQEAEELDPDDFTRDQISTVWVEIARNQRLAQDTRSSEENDLPEEAAARAKREEREAGTDRHEERRRTEIGLSRPNDVSTSKGAPPPEDAGGSSTAGWVVTATGGAIIVGTVVYHLLMLEQESEFLDLSEKGGDRGRYNTLKSRIDTATWLVPTLYAAGGATTGVGVWLLIRRTDASDDSSAHRSSTSFGIHATFSF